MSYKFVVTTPERITYEVFADQVQHGFDSPDGPHGDVYVFHLDNEVVAAFPVDATVIRTDRDDDEMAVSVQGAHLTRFAVTDDDGQNLAKIVDRQNRNLGRR